MYMEMCSLNVFCIFELKTSEIPDPRFASPNALPPPRTHWPSQSACQLVIRSSLGPLISTDE